MIWLPVILAFIQGDGMGQLVNSLGVLIGTVIFVIFIVFGVSGQEIGGVISQLNITRQSRWVLEGLTYSLLGAGFGYITNLLWFDGFASIGYGALLGMLLFAITFVYRNLIYRLEKKTKTILDGMLVSPAIMYGIVAFGILVFV
ncbi:hypothetical protein [Salsuginibacillus kocurii]|uniref:hypothetical protein n=1 Tax=Salsuginibacillus kocurii TaxID=427078 RepID=UPI0012EA1F41|nr:hypothetical protein [Salsuginibacillus kocurii]